MLFGGDVEESSVPARIFVKRAIGDFIYLESKVSSINTESGNVNAEAPPTSALINLIVTFFLFRHFFRSSMTFPGIYLG